MMLARITTLVMTLTGIGIALRCAPGESAALLSVALIAAYLLASAMVDAAELLASAKVQEAAARVQLEVAKRDPEKVARAAARAFRDSK